MKSIISLFALLMSLPSFASIDKEKANELAEAAWNYYYFAEFAQAETALKEALDYNPSDKKLRLGYAKTLYRNGKYKESIQALEGETFSGKDADESDFLIALSHFNNYAVDASQPYFEKVANRGGKLSTTAKTYLDNLDERRKRTTASAAFGLIYDSSIIDEDLVSTTDGSDGRIFIGGDINYRVKRLGQMDVSVIGSVASLYSFDDNNSIADPLVISGGGQFDRAITFREKNYDMRISPRLELVWIDLTSTGSRDLFLASPLIDVVLSEKENDGKFNSFYGTVRFDMGQEDSLDNTDGDVDGLNLTGGWRETQPREAGRYTQRGAFAKLNFASGDNIKFYRAGGHYTYVMPWKNWNLGIVGDGKFSIYPNGDRSDLDLAVAATGTRSMKELTGWPVEDWLILELRAGYAVTLSNVDANDDNRFIVSSLLKGNWKF